MKYFKLIMITFFLCILSFFLIYIIVVNYYPSFGDDLTDIQKEEFKKFKNFKDGKFINRLDVPEKLTFNRFLDLGYKYFTTKVKNGVPNFNIPIINIDSSDLKEFKGTRMFWFGHSAFLVQHNSVNILIDPMFGKVPAPMDFLGGKRFSKKLPIRSEKLPEIDYVLISHDHYDHLDYESILKIKNKVNKFIVPLGLGNHLIKWGVSKKKIIEFNWWDSKVFDGINFICTPAQHFSGRKFNNYRSTLWSSWVIKSDSLSLYFSGDSGYDIHFKNIGEKFGPFDVSLLESGQYNKLWPDVHMFPKETVKAGIDLKSKKIIPIHWGAFKLAMHPWNEPAIEVLKESNEKNLIVEIPKIGEPITIDSLDNEIDNWWIPNF